MSCMVWRDVQEGDERQGRTWLNEILEWTWIGNTVCVREAEDSGEAKGDRQVIMFYLCECFGIIVLSTAE